MAAYAALVSLMNVVDQIKNHPHHSASLDKMQIESLDEKVGFVLDFVESYSHGGSKEAECLEAQIVCAAHRAEDLIESHVVDQILAGSPQNFCGCCLQKVMVDLDSIKETVMEVTERQEGGFKDQQPTYSVPAALSGPLTTAHSTMVGFEDEFIQLLDGLTGQQSGRLIMPLVGMGGIGKTTLARHVFENLAVEQHFDVRAWAPVSLKYNVREILIQLLCFQKKQENTESFAALKNEIDHKTEEQLGEQLNKFLSGRRYLIVLDDVWSIDAWDKLKFYFPDYNNRSRIIITTRLSHVALHFGSSFLEMNFLDEDKSWKLFCEKAFGQQDCPPQLEKIGKEIAKRCKGLPLLIVVIGGLLQKSNKAQEYWEDFAKGINSNLHLKEDEQCLNILSLSYSHLPAYLKPCFLYMGVFPEDHEIRVSRLIKLWVAEGFLRPSQPQSLEEIAEGYLKDLIDRNLILVHKIGSNGRIKTCSIHDLLRELCLRIAEKENLLCVRRVLDSPRGTDKDRRIVFHECIPEEYHPGLFRTLQSASFARSLICTGGQMLYLFKLLRVLNVVGRDSLEALLEQVNLRYIACEGVWRDYQLLSSLPSSISLLWNVQTLIIRGGIERFVAPSEIWEMRQLRHLEFDEISLPQPSCEQADQQDNLVLPYLQTLLRVVNFVWSEDACKRIPSIKKLYINYIYYSETLSHYCLRNIGRFHKLESLKYIFFGPPDRDDLLQNLTFPSSLKKLSLSYCHLTWEDLTIIGSLPHLEVLKLENEAVMGPKWDPVEGEFLRLKFLKIFSCSDLIYWNADNFHFPVLEILYIDELTELEEIPLGIGEIPTLRVIRVDFCSESAAISAIKILEEQESYGNVELQVRVKVDSKADLEMLREMVEEETLTSRNLLLEAALSNQ